MAKQEKCLYEVRAKRGQLSCGNGGASRSHLSRLMRAGGARPLIHLLRSLPPPGARRRQGCPPGAKMNDGGRRRTPVNRVAQFAHPPPPPFPPSGRHPQSLPAAGGAPAPRQEPGGRGEEKEGRGGSARPPCCRSPPVFQRPSPPPPPPLGRRLQVPGPPARLRRPVRPRQTIHLRLDRPPRRGGGAGRRVVRRPVRLLPRRLQGRHPGRPGRVRGRVPRVGRGAGRAVRPVRAVQGEHGARV
jgi:hypothetical protein